MGNAVAFQLVRHDRFWFLTMCIEQPFKEFLSGSTVASMR